jgi:hypothetical protein
VNVDAEDLRYAIRRIDDWTNELGQIAELDGGPEVQDGWTFEDECVVARLEEAVRKAAG